MTVSSLPLRQPGRSNRAAPRRIDVPGPVDLEGPATRVLELVRAVGRRIRQRPLTALAAAVGVGFVVGGALSFRAGRIALAAAARHLAHEISKRVL
jgi:hypothetical protein